MRKRTQIAWLVGWFVDDWLIDCQTLPKKKRAPWYGGGAQSTTLPAWHGQGPGVSLALKASKQINSNIALLDTPPLRG